MSSNLKKGSGSMQTNRRQVEVQQVQILNDERINTYLI